MQLFSSIILFKNQSIEGLVRIDVNSISNIETQPTNVQFTMNVTFLYNNFTTIPNSKTLNDNIRNSLLQCKKNGVTQIFTQAIVNDFSLTNPTFKTTETTSSPTILPTTTCLIMNSATAKTECNENNLNVYLYKNISSNVSSKKF